MNPQEQTSSGSDAATGLVQGKHQGGLVTMLFTEVAGSTALNLPPADHGTVTQVRVPQ